MAAIENPAILENAMRRAGVIFLAAFPALSASLPPEVQFSSLSLRAGEKARLTAALGPLEDMPFMEATLFVLPAKRQVRGQLSLTLTVQEATRPLYLRLLPNVTHPEAVRLTAGGAQVQLLRRTASLLQVVLPASVAPGQRLRLQLQLQAQLPPLPAKAGFMSLLQDASKGDYGAFSASENVLSLAGILPMVPMKQAAVEKPLGIGDVGAFAPTNFLVSIVAPKGWQPVAAGHDLGSKPQGTQHRRFTWALAGARGFPVLLLKGYKLARKSLQDITLASYFLKADAATGLAVLQHAAKALELLEEKLGPYPYKTFRVVEAPLHGGAGGMEFPGLVTVASALYGPEVPVLPGFALPGAAVQQLTGPLLKPFLEEVLELTVYHEVAHQYFAMLLGSNPVTHPLADEALAQHVALLLVEWRHGKAAADGMRHRQLKMAYQYHRLLGGRDGVADRPTYAFESNREYAALVYGKAPLLLDVQRALVGEKAWEAALKQYVAKYRYAWVTQDSLTALLVARHAALAKQLRALKQRWWKEAHGDEDLGVASLEDVLGGFRKMP